MKNKKEWLIITTLVMAIVMTFTLMLTPISVSANARDDYEQAQAELNKIEQQLNSIKDTKQKQQQEQKKYQLQHQKCLIQQLILLKAQKNYKIYLRILSMKLKCFNYRR